METKRCNQCKAVKSVSEFAKKGNRQNYRCKACHNAYYKNYLKNKDVYEKHKARVKAWKEQNKLKITADKYGITVEEYEQGISGLCQCCGINQASVVDHCHVSGKFRGFLCNSCNLGIGLLGDSLAKVEKAVLYLQLCGSVSA